MKTKTYKLHLIDDIPLRDSTGKAIPDALGARIDRIYAAEPALSDFRLATAFETSAPVAGLASSPPPTHLVLIFQAP